MINTAFKTHPFGTVRAAELQRWIQSGEYARIIGGDYPRRGSEGDRPLGDDYAASGAAPLRILVIGIVPMAFVQGYFAVCRGTGRLREAVAAGWFGDVEPTGVTRFDPVTGELSPTATNADDVAAANAAIIYAASAGRAGTKL